MSKTKDHEIHKYYQSKFKTSGTVIYRCGLEGCPHFVYEPLILNRLSICWRCGDSFVLTQNKFLEARQKLRDFLDSDRKRK